jgi:Zn-dependent membrane protease YugP
MSSEERRNSMATAVSCDHVAGFRADHVAPRMRSVVASARTFTKPSVSHGAGAAIGGEGELADLVGDARGLELLPRSADRGDFRGRCR